METALKDKLHSLFAQTRNQTMQIVEPLETEDYGLQCMDDASPPKWHLAHTTWFFEKFILTKFVPDYEDFDSEFNFIFNSYYNLVGAMHNRCERGFLSRPTVKNVLKYREHVDKAIGKTLDSGILSGTQFKELERLIKIGINHEQQHQELMLTDIKYNFFKNPLAPTYSNNFVDTAASAGAKTKDPLKEWSSFDGGLQAIGTNSDESFDNERPQHRKFIEKFSMASRLVTNGEFLKFVKDNGYRRPEFWMSEAWNLLQADKWQMPLYWQNHENAMQEFRLDGLKLLILDDPIMHLSFYEADAYARYMQARLPFEEEWEFVASNANDANDMKDLFGSCWQWTVSSYLPYPGFRAESGALREYNGKFMCGQKVLRGSSLYTSTGQSSATYRNFFPASTRWQRTGIRLVRD